MQLSVDDQRTDVKAEVRGRVEDYLDGDLASRGLVVAHVLSRITPPCWSMRSMGNMRAEDQAVPLSFVSVGLGMFERTQITAPVPPTNAGLTPAGLVVPAEDMRCAVDRYTTVSRLVGG